MLILLALAGGRLLGIPGDIPREFLASALLALAPASAVAAWQSMLSMVIRNFAAPIAIGLVAAIVSFGALASGAPGVKFMLPPALLSDTLWLGSSAVADAGALTAATVVTVIAASAIMAFAGWLASVVYLRRTDARL